jgi:GNAT superfamily N-acetyltransferase
LPLEDTVLEDELMKEQITEEREGDEFVYKLSVNDKMVCGARIEPYSLLSDIKTTEGEEGKGYAKKLLTHIEKIARENNAKTMETNDIDPCDYKAICFFKSMDYRLNLIEKDETKFLEGKKDLWGKKILRLIQKVDENFKKISFDMFYHSQYFGIFCVILFMLIPIEIYLFSIGDIAKQLVVVIPFSALLIAFARPFYDSVFETRTLRNYVTISENEGDSSKPLLMALVKMKGKNERLDFKLEQIFSMNPSMFTKEKLLERLYN